MTKTSRDVIIEALRLTGAVPLDQVPDADLFENTKSKYENFHAYLNNKYKRSVVWQIDSVPDDVWTNIAAMFANVLIGSVPMATETQERVRFASLNGERMFREFKTRTPNKTVEVSQV